MEELIQRIQAEDVTALEELYQMVRPMGIKVASSYVGQEGLEEDMFHEAFIKAVNHLDKFETGRSFQAWFDVIVANTCKSHLRKNKTDSIEAIEEQGNSIEKSSNIGNPEECWEQQEVQEIVKGFLGDISKEQKEAIVLHYYQGMSVTEIAEYQQCNVQTVKSRLYQGRNKLREIISDYEKRTNIKLHSIGVVPAIYIFFKSETGQSYGKAVFAAAQVAVGTAEVLAQEGTGLLAGKAVEEATKVVAAEITGEIASKHLVKMAIGIIVTSLVGGGITYQITQQEDWTEESENTVIETTQELEESVEMMATEEEELLLQEEESRPNETVTEDVEDVEHTWNPENEIAQYEDEIDYNEWLIYENQELGMTIYEAENGIIRVVTDLDKSEMHGASGGTMIVSDANGYGVFDYAGNELVPVGSYKSYKEHDDMGNFIMSTDDTFYFYNAQGKMVYSFTEKNCTVELKNGYVTYIRRDETTEDCYVCCYDINTEKLVTIDIPEVQQYINVTAVDEGKFLIGCQNREDDWKQRYSATVDGEIRLLCEGPDIAYEIHGNYYNDYAWAGNIDSFCLISTDEKKNISFKVADDLGSWRYTGFDIYYNYGTKIALSTDIFSEDGTVKSYLADLKDYDINTGFEACILAEHDWIFMGEMGVFWGLDGQDACYMTDDGVIIKDDYVGQTPFKGKYAVMMDAAGLMHLIDYEFNVLTKGYPATDIRIWKSHSFINGNEETTFVIK